MRRLALHAPGRLVRRATVVAAALAMAVGMTGTPAAAASGPWSTFSTACKESWCVNYGNLVRLWQSVLWADGMFDNVNEVDGEFGSRTHTRTVTWQYTWVPGDSSGKVGPNTWGAAEYQRLDVDTNGDICIGGQYRYTYHGLAGRSFSVRQNCSTKEWTFRNPRTGAFIDTSYVY